MQFKEFFTKVKIPWIPLSAIIFLGMLENLYNKYGLISLFVATILEGIVYLGLYFSGSSIMVLIILFSPQNFISLLSISLVITFALIVVSIINYVLGRHVLYRKGKESTEVIRDKKFSKGLLLSSVHPNFLAFYFFNLGY